MKATHYLAIGIAAAIALLVSAAIANKPDLSEKTSSSSKQAHPNLVVHEWGTFTSVFGSDGTMLPGLEAEEEHLPQFVYAHDGNGGGPQLFANGGQPMILATKGFKRPLYNVTIKMETPVLYFYSPEKIEKARVRVGFEGGSISQWYPARSGGEKMPILRFKEGKLVGGPIDFGKKPFEGSIEWDFSIEAPMSEADSDFAVLKPGETANWLHPRAPHSNVLTNANGEQEKYLFYRGVGNFKQPIEFSASGDYLHINAEEKIPYLLLFESNSAGGRVVWEGPLEPGTRSINLESSESDFGAEAEWRGPAYVSLKGALADAGLSEEEASSMLRSWWSSYFGKSGLRAFWVVPRSFTDKILPIEIEPAPEKLERVLLGRSEILTPAFEKILITRAESAEQKGDQPFIGDRYALAYKARLKQLRPVVVSSE